MDGAILPQFGNAIYTLGAFVLALSVIVFIHEYGHYIIGRLSGIKAEVFSLGFGPVLWSRRDRHGTRWQIAALPFGGYVKFLGDANAASAGADGAVMARLTPAERRHTMEGAPLWARAATVAAGPIFNFILSVVIFAGIFLAQGFATDEPQVGALYPLPGGAGAVQAGDAILSVNGRPAPDYPSLYAIADDLKAEDRLSYGLRRDGRLIEAEGPALFPARAASIAPDSAAQAAGLRPGDVLVAIDGQPVASFPEVQALIGAAEGAAVSLTIWRPQAQDAGSASAAAGLPLGESFTLALTPKRTDMPRADGGFETRWLIGLGGEFFFAPVTRQPGLGEAIVAGGNQVVTVVSGSLSALGHMITGAISSCNLRGPLGIAETSASAASAGLVSFIWFLGVLSTAVGFMNLFPIPVLDGGHLVFHAYEAITGKPPSPRLMQVLMTAGLAIVLCLMAFGLTNDLRC